MSSPQVVAGRGPPWALDQQRRRNQTSSGDDECLSTNPAQRLDEEHDVVDEILNESMGGWRGKCMSSVDDASSRASTVEPFFHSTNCWTSNERTIALFHRGQTDRPKMNGTVPPCQ
jgi:hypothetical protein